MIVGTAAYTFRIPLAHSLKDKRRLVKSLLERVRQRYHAAAAEVDCQDVWQKAVIGVAVVSNDTRHAEEMLEHITHFMEEFSVEMELIQVDIELL